MNIEDQKAKFEKQILDFNTWIRFEKLKQKEDLIKQGWNCYILHYEWCNEVYLIHPNSGFQLELAFGEYEVVNPDIYSLTEGSISEDKAYDLDDNINELPQDMFVYFTYLDDKQCLSKVNILLGFM